MFQWRGILWFWDPFAVAKFNPRTFAGYHGHFIRHVNDIQGTEFINYLSTKIWGRIRIISTTRTFWTTYRVAHH